MLTKEEYNDYSKRLLNFANHFFEDKKYTKEDIVIFANSMLLKLLTGYTIHKNGE